MDYQFKTVETPGGKVLLEGKLGLRWYIEPEGHLRDEQTGTLIEPDGTL